MKTLTAMLVLLGVLSGAVAASAEGTADGAWSGVTVLMNDGWRYRDVVVYLDSMGAGLWVLRDDGAERLVAADRVARIVGRDGSDITGRVLAGERGPVLAVPPPDQEVEPVAWDGAAAPVAAAAQPADERLMKLAFTLEGGYGWPRGDWFWGNDASWTAGARLRIGTVKRSYLGLGARYQNFEQAFSADGGPVRTSSAMVYEGTFGWMSRPSSGGTSTYLELGVALLENRDEYRYEWDDQDPFFETEITRTERTGAFVLRGGVMVPLWGGVFLDMSASAVFRGMLFKPEDEEEAALLAVHCGLTWRN